MPARWMRSSKRSRSIPNSTRTRNNLGNTYIAQQKLELAEKEFRTVLRLDPANSDGNYNLALLLMAKGSPAEAIVHLQRVRPATLPVRFNLIRAYLRAGRVAEGLKTATEISAQNESDVQLHTTLGVLLASEKQYRAATFELEKANALQPETFEILYNLGQAYLRNREYSKAELTLSRALKLKPDSPETLYLMAQVYSEQIAIGGCAGFAGQGAQAGAGKYGCDFSAGSREHVAELFRGCDSVAGIGAEAGTAAGRSACRAGRELLHVWQDGEGHRGVQRSGWAGSVGAFVCVSGAFLPTPGAIR